LITFIDSLSGKGHACFAGNDYLAKHLFVSPAHMLMRFRSLRCVTSRGRMTFAKGRNRFCRPAALPLGYPVESGLSKQIRRLFAFPLLFQSPIYRNVANSRPRSGACGAVSRTSETEPTIIAATDGKSTEARTALFKRAFRRLGSSVRSVLVLSLSTRYDDAMSRLTWLFHFLLVSLGLLTGCTMLSRNYNRIRAELTKPETDEDTHNYGAYFEAPFSATSKVARPTHPAQRRDGAK
jgi:hypothetical protein